MLRKSVKVTLPEPKESTLGKQTRDIVADKIGMKASTFERAAKVWEKAKEGDQNLPDFINGPLVSISLTSEQRAAVEAQTRTLRGLEQMIVERYPGVIE